MTFIMKEVFIMNFGGFLFNPHYLHTLLHDVIKTHYEPPKIIMNTSFIMKVIMTLIVFQCDARGRVCFDWLPGVDKLVRTIRAQLIEPTLEHY